MGKRELKPIADVSIGSAWKEYAAEVMPVGVTRKQFRDMQGAFYAGAACMLYATNRIAQEDVTEEEGVEILEALHKEVRAFVDARIGEHRRMQAGRRPAPGRAN